MVLDLLVGEEDHEHDDAGRDRVDGGDDHHRHPGQEPSHQGKQVHQGHEGTQQEGEGNPEDGQGDPDDDAGDQRGQEVAQHVAGHRADRLVDDPAQADRGGRAEEAEQPAATAATTRAW